MTNTPFTVTVHMVSSLDGFVAKKDNSVSWFETTAPYEKGVDGEDPETFLKTIDCYVMGSRTYELALELSKSYGWAYGEKPVVVISDRRLPVKRETVEIISGDLQEIFHHQLKKKYTNIWVAGGPALTKSLLREKLVDEIRMTILPILLGEGLPFFDPAAQEAMLEVKDVKAYKNGMVELHYALKK